MSEQNPPKPLFVVISNIRATTIAQRDEDGFYRTVLQMQYPFDQFETALQLCEMLNAINEPLAISKAGQ